MSGGLMSTDENQVEGDQLTLFLQSCLKKEEHVKQVKAKLDEEGIDYNGLYKIDEADLRETLRVDCGIKNYRVGLIVDGFRQLDGSGASKHPSGATMGGFVVLTEKHNQFILSTQQRLDNIKGNIAKLENAADGIQQSAKNVTAQINDYHSVLIGILNQQKEKSMAKLELIKNKKMEQTKKGLVASEEALKFLEKSDDDFKRVLNDKKLDITKKHGAITKHIEASQKLIGQYANYLEAEMRLPTNVKIEYEANDKQLFKAFVESLDNVIDSDIVFNKIQIQDDDINIEWKSAMQQMNEASFFLECKEIKKEKNDDEKEQDFEWKLFQKLKATQTQVSLFEGAEKLKECTDYKFRILVKVSNYKIYSKTLAVKTPEFKSLKSAMITAKESKQLLNWIVDKKANKFELLFKGSRDGFDSQQFHQKCDGQGPTITIVKSDNQDHIFWRLHVKIMA